MTKYLILILFFFWSHSFAQPPRIDSMFVDEKTNELKVYGDFGFPKGAVWVDSIQLQINSWSDSLIIALIPSSGKGSSGLVVVGGRSYRSEGRMLTQWIMGMTFAAGRSASYYTEYTHDEWQVTWRCDLDSRLRLAHNGVGQYVLVSLSEHENHTYHLDQYDPQTKQSIIKDENLSGSGVANGYLDITKMIFYPKVLDLAHNNGYAYTPIIALDTGFFPINGSINVGNDGFHPAMFSWGNPIGLPNLVINPPSILLRQLRHQPILLKPDSGSVSLTTIGDTLVWDSLALVTQYHLQVFTDSLLSAIFTDTVISYVKFELPTLSNNTKYFWRVAGKNTEGEGRWSNVWNFTTGSKASVHDLENTHIMIYPNPANEKITIEYDKSSDETFKVTIFSLEGNIAKSFTIKGENSVDVSKLAQGSYVLQIQGIDFHAAKNICIVK